jgi:hypothetical protein
MHLMCRRSLAHVYMTCWTEMQVMDQHLLEDKLRMAFTYVTATTCKDLHCKLCCKLNLCKLQKSEGWYVLFLVASTAH